ncbi:MAG: hypothetical protein KatS3mg005_4151 [Bryobacteraceae bacterium]|nr:MAG: hypothetical protein KatS3mg005_4151 [Bryobacteraceae bacterium]
MANIYYSQAYTGNPVYVAEFTPATRADWVNNVIGALLTAGWSHISGSGTDRVLGSGTTPDNLRYKVRIWDPGTGNCARVGLRSWNEMLLNDSAAAFCFPGSLTWKIVASAYQAFAWVPGSTSARTFVFFTAPKLEPAMNVTVTDCAYLGSNDDGDTNTTGKTTLRTRLFTQFARVGIVLNNESLFSASQSSDRAISVRTQAPDPAGDSATKREWLDGSRDVMEARIAFHPTTAAKWLGYLWDALVIYQSMIPDQTVTWDGKNWTSITSNNDNSTDRGTLCLLI